MSSISKAQMKALRDCEESGLWNDRINFWRWYRTLPNGVTYLAASNPTIATLKARGYLKLAGDNRVEITPKGRAALAPEEKK